jgi:Putative metallopeptidase
MPTRRFLAAIAGLSVVLWSLLLLGGGAAFAQQASSSSPSFHERVRELASALQNSPRLKKLSEQQRLERVEFVVGNTLFTLLHEMGHVLIAEMKLPILGREEDAADTYAALRMLKIGTPFSEHIVGEASKNWFLIARRDQETGAKPIYYGEHSLSQQRAYQIVCLMVGSDRAKFKGVADGIKMPQERQESCQKDYAKASWSWDTVLKPHLRLPDQPQKKINVVYSDAPGPLAGFARSFRSVRMLEGVAQRSSADYAWPAPFTLEMRSCGGPEAAWSEETRILRVCYELAFDFAELYGAYVPAASIASSKQKRKLK